jgi:hypothetical protein
LSLRASRKVFAELATIELLLSLRGQSKVVKRPASIVSALGKRKIPLIEGAPTTCCHCGAKLCVRKQVVNLALGNPDEMQCLQCLANESETGEAEVLTSARGYVMSRECFRKEWNKYPDRKACPDPKGCIPGVCFNEGARSACPR